MFREVKPIYEICPEGSHVKGSSLPLIFCPEANFLSKSAVICSGSGAKGKTKFCSSETQFLDHFSNLTGVCFEKIFEELPFFRCVRVKRERSPANIKVICFLQFFNTPGNEVTPGSDII
jgi:hypothetical protein